MVEGKAALMRRMKELIKDEVQGRLIRSVQSQRDSHDFDIDLNRSKQIHLSPSLAVATHAHTHS